jgi:aerobic carbon-monoxide dehydrogenase medium subunit
MRPFELAEPATLEEAVTLLEQDELARPIAGGTALLLMVKSGLFQPETLISLRRLRPELAGIARQEDGRLRIGAMTSLTELGRSPLVREMFPVMSQTLQTLSNVRIRNVATIGGHLAHGDPHMDLPPVLLCLGARVRARGPQGERWIGLDDLYAGYYETTLARDELITEVVVPAPPPSSASSYVKFTSLSADDWPAVGVAVSAIRHDGTLGDVRVALGAATERAVRLGSVEAQLEGKAPSAELVQQAGDSAAQEVRPLGDLRGSAEYKREMVRVHARRAVKAVLEALAFPEEAVR